MRVIVLKHGWQVGLWTAIYAMQRIRSVRSTRKEAKFCLAVPTGSTALAMYRALVYLYKHGYLSFREVMLFNLDEYLGLPPNHVDSYFYYLHQNFIDHVDFCKSNVFLFNGTLTDYYDGEESVTLSPVMESYLRDEDTSPQELHAAVREANRIESHISENGGLNMVIAGVGRDGHIGFNEPGSSLLSKTRIKTLNSDTIEANEGLLSNVKAPLPRRAITMGIGTMLSANEVIIMATGRKKALAIQAAVEGSISHQWPISALQNHERAIIVCDEDAVEELKVKTVKYFQLLEKTELNLYNSDSFDDVVSKILTTVL